MASFVTNPDGTTSIKHSKDEIAQAKAANAATAAARTDQIEADAAHAGIMTTARVASAAAAIPADDEGDTAAASLKKGA